MKEKVENQTMIKTPNLGGRPTLAKTEVLSFRLVTRVNDEDNRTIQRDFLVWRSGRVGRIADYLREIILTRNTPKAGGASGRVASDQIVESTQTLHHIRQSLKHIEISYSQIVNQVISIRDAEELQNKVQESKAMMDKISPLIEQIDQLVKVQTELIFKN